MDITNHFKYFNDLNVDLQNLILSKIRYPISKELDADIVNFKILLIIIEIAYFKK